jgi:hypothetical protein
MFIVAIISYYYSAPSKPRRSNSSEAALDFISAIEIK